jgi:dihydrodipicolinate synthase/N-acetylneuraminate lyase
MNARETDACRFPQVVLATCCVPWGADEELDEQVFREGVELLLRRGLEHLYVFGTAGEGYAVDERRFDAVVSAFHDVMAVRMRKDPRSVMVGVISTSLPAIIDRIERAAALGITHFQISLPPWGAVADDELLRFFDETCGRFSNLAFLHYNLPRSRRVLTPGEYAVLAERHPNLVATKNAGADPTTARDLLTLAPQLRHFFTEPSYAHAAGNGAAGLLLSVASMNPELALDYFRAGRDRDRTALAEMGAELVDLIGELQDIVGTERIDGAYDKCFSKALDSRFPLRLLPPYSGATEAQFERFLHRVRQRYPRWAPEEVTASGRRASRP